MSSMREPIGAYITTEGDAVERMVAGGIWGRHAGLTIVNASTGWCAYDRDGLTRRVDEDEAGEINAKAQERRAKPFRLEAK